MLADPRLMHDPVYYNNIWLLIGVFLLLIAATVVFLIFFATRKKKIKTIANLTVSPPTVIDLSSLRQKYLNMVSNVVKRYDAGELKASEAHQKLSLIVRRFFAESYGFRAEYLTLSDLKKSNKKSLTDAIEKYYPEEFNLLQQGSVLSAAKIASDLISKEGIDNA